MSFSLLFRKYPLFRTSLYALAVALALAVLSALTFRVRKVPRIEKIDPAVGSAGDTMTISGENFGERRENSFVLISGSRVTSSGYVEWGDSSIRIIIPANAQDGLVYVVTEGGRSRPSFFANAAGIPVEAPPDTKMSLPVVASVSPSSSPVGGVVTISGANFGSVRGGSQVLFSADSGSGEGDAVSVAASDSDFDYESWTDSEIRVRVPDGAATGGVFVRTEKGESGTRRLEVKDSAGKKSRFAGKTYALRLEQDIDSAVSDVDASITLRVPRPVVSFSQPEVELNECVPPPLVSEFKNTLIHQIDVSPSNSQKTGKYKFSEDFVVTVHSVGTDVDLKNVRQYDKNRILYKKYTAADPLVDSESEKVVFLAREIAGNEKNPYLQAKKVYSFLAGNYTLLTNPRTGDGGFTEFFERKSGDACDFSVAFAALLRALGIPCVPVGGILVDADTSVRCHWWNEFYLEGLGWIPVDIALAIGLPFSLTQKVEDPGGYYFGSLDFQHIAFSRGWNEIKQSLVNGKIVRRPRSFALQSIWEESSESSVSYSSLWSVPVVLGIY